VQGLTVLENDNLPVCQVPSQMRANLSHMEIQIANLIKAGEDSKKVGDILGVSVNTLTARRFHLRTKLGLKKEKVTLKSHLKSIVFLVI